MNQFDVLSQASALPILSNNSVLFLTSQHVVLPWLYKNYYAADWLDFVKPQHTAYTIECRESGQIRHQFRLSSDSIIQHSTRDVAALSLECDDDEFLNTTTFDGLITLSEHRLNKQKNVTVAGYEISEKLFEYDEKINSSDKLCVSQTSNLMKEFRSLNSIEKHNGFREQIPVNMKDCRFSDIRGHQHFLKTPMVLAEGMCGGGVFGIDDGGAASTMPKDDDDGLMCHGIIEGIVPLNSAAAPELAGHTSYIDSVSILEWLKSSES